MRAFRPFLVLAWLGACRGTVEVRGLYVNAPDTAGRRAAGEFVLCDRPKAVWHISDAVLATKYRRTATQPYQPMFVRLRGVRVDSGSIYYSSHHFLVRQIVELRAPRPGECRVNAVLKALGLAP